MVNLYDQHQKHGQECKCIYKAHISPLKLQLSSFSIKVLHFKSHRSAGRHSFFFLSLLTHSTQQRGRGKQEENDSRYQNKTQTLYLLLWETFTSLISYRKNLLFPALLKALSTAPEHTKHSTQLPPHPSKAHKIPHIYCSSLGNLIDLMLRTGSECPHGPLPPPSFLSLS